MSEVIRTKCSAGSTFDFELTLPKEVTQYENVVVYLYTAKYFPIKFSYVPKTGYNSITSGSTPDVIKLKMLGYQSIRMSGPLSLEVLLIENSTEEFESIGNGGVDTTIDIVQHLIREEL